MRRLTEPMPQFDQPIGTCPACQSLHAASTYVTEVDRIEVTCLVCDMVRFVPSNTQLPLPQQ